MLMPGRFDPCQLAWQVNQLSSQSRASERTAAGPRETWPTGFFSRFASLWARCVGCALADKLGSSQASWPGARHHQLEMKIFSHATLLILVFLPLSAAGAPIMWGAATDVSAASDVVSSGTLVEAYNAGANDVVSRTVNGVLFTGTGGLLPNNNAGDFYSDTTGDAAYDALLGSLDFGGGTDETLSMGEGSLVTGNMYQVQVWYVDQVSLGRDQYFGDGDADTSNDVQLFGETAQYAIGTFTADGTGYQDLEIRSGASGHGNVHITAYQLRSYTTVPDVPSVVLYGNTSTDTPEYRLYVTFSEEVSGLETSDFVVVNGRAASVEPQGRSYSLDGYYDTTNSRYYAATLAAASPGPVSVTLPAGAVTDIDGDGATNTVSNTLTFQCRSDFREHWIVDEEAEWTAAAAGVSNLTLSGGYAEPTADAAHFTSTIKTFPIKKRARTLTFRQSPAWDNWIKSATSIGASGAGDATILLPIGDKDYYHLGKYGSDGYHAWHSTNMVDWTHHGIITPKVHRWVTTAEYKDGSFYIYVDYPNDHTPHLYIDNDLKDGVIGTFMGMAFNDPTHGSDNSVIRDNADGLFHIISEDWSPIKASTHSWDSPLATHASSADGVNGFVAGEHVSPIDHRTTPTGTYGTYDHPHVAGTHISNPCVYEIHTPEQDAFGDWTSVKVGSRYYLFGDFDHADGSTISCALFTSDSLYEQYELVGDIKCGGHPDPTCGFAEGQFYLITQKSDYTSPGPWVDGVEARVGVDVDADGTVDQWTAWQSVVERYDHTPGYARVVATTPAQLNLSGLPEGYGFQFEFRIDNTVVADISPIMDRVVMQFYGSQGTVMAVR